MADAYYKSTALNPSLGSMTLTTVQNDAAVGDTTTGDLASVRTGISGTANLTLVYDLGTTLPISAYRFTFYARHNFNVGTPVYAVTVSLLDSLFNFITTLNVYSPTPDLSATITLPAQNFQTITGSVTPTSGRYVRVTHSMTAAGSDVAAVTEIKNTDFRVTPKPVTIAGTLPADMALSGTSLERTPRALAAALAADLALSARLLSRRPIRASLGTDIAFAGSPRLFSMDEECGPEPNRPVEVMAETYNRGVRR